MAQQLKKKFIGDDQVDGSKIKLLQGEAIRGKDSSNNDVELIKIDPTDKVLLKGQEAAFKSQIDAEQSRAESAESVLQGNIDAEETRAMAAEGVLQSNINSEESSRISADNALDARLDVLEADPTTKTYVDGQVSGLQSQIDNVVSNIDPAALDSLTEVVAAFQSADNDINAAIAALGTGASSALAQEILDRQAADANLQSQITQEISDRQSAVSGVQTSLDNEISRATAAESALDVRLDVLEADPTTKTYVDGQVASLQSQIDDADAYAISVADDLAQEIVDRTSADTTLQNNIDAEESARISADTTITNNLNSEISRATAAEGVLTTNLASEVSRAQTAEADLQSQINTEVTARQNAIISVQNDLSDEVTRATAAEGVLQTNIDAEETRALAAEGVLQSNINQEISDRIADVDAEQSRAEAAELALDGRLDVLEADPTTKTYVDGQVSTLQGEINNIISNVDPAALDSLTEIVDAFQTADGDLLAAINALSTGSSSALNAEIARATAAEAAIASDLADEISRATAAEGVIASDLASEISRATAAEGVIASDLASEISRATAAESALDVRVDVLESVTWAKHSVVLTGAVAFINLPHLIVPGSLHAFVDRLAIHEGSTEDYTVSTVSGVTRVTFLNDMIAPGNQSLGNGDTLYFRYQYKA
jgi:hypothetical protein